MYSTNASPRTHAGTVHALIQIIIARLFSFLFYDQLHNRQKINIPMMARKEHNKDEKWYRSVWKATETLTYQNTTKNSPPSLVNNVIPDQAQQRSTTVYCTDSLSQRRSSSFFPCGGLPQAASPPQLLCRQFCSVCPAEQTRSPCCEYREILIGVFAESVTHSAS